MHDALYAALSEDKQLSERQCLAINQALGYLGARLVADLRAKRRGAPIALENLRAATIASELMDKHGATAKAAAIAALPKGSIAEYATIERLCRTLRRREPRAGQVVIVVSPTLVERAASRLPKKRR
jgi:hypothetical protein